MFAFVYLSVIVLIKEHSNSFVKIDFDQLWMAARSNLTFVAASATLLSDAYIAVSSAYMLTDEVETVDGILFV